MLHSRVPQRITIPAGASRVTLTVQTVNDRGDPAGLRRATSSTLNRWP